MITALAREEFWGEGFGGEASAKTHINENLVMRCTNKFVSTKNDTNDPCEFWRNSLGQKTSKRCNNPTFASTKQGMFLSN